MTERVELGTVLAAMRARFFLATVLVSLAVLAGYIVTERTPKVYAATTSVLVGKTTESANLTREDILASQDLAATYSDLARREPVLGPVATGLGLPGWLELRERVLVNVAPGNSQLIVVTANGPSPEAATQIARSITDQLIQLAPSRTDDPNVAFLRTQVERLQQEIQRRQTELGTVIAQQAATLSVEQAQAFQSRADILTRQISDLQGNYTNLRGLLPSEGGANALTVLEPPNAAPEPVRPNLRMNLVISAILGLLLAAGVCYRLEFRRRRPRRDRRWPDRQVASPASRPGPGLPPANPAAPDSLTGALARQRDGEAAVSRSAAGVRDEDR